MALTEERSAFLPNDPEQRRHQNMLEQAAFHARLDAIRLAQQTLVENSRNKPVEDREVTPDDIVAFAKELTDFIGS
jgi:hypothetical protein